MTFALLARGNVPFPITQSQVFVPNATGQSRVGWFGAVSQHVAARRTGLQLLGLAVGINAALFGLFLALGTPGYETNDDLTMQMIASGFYTGQPSEHLVFTNVIVGWVLRCLYSVWHGWNWYLAYLLAVHFAALTALAYVILGRRRDGLFLALWVGFFGLVEVRLLVNLQFTTTAFLAGTAGVVLLVEALTAGNSVSWPKAVAGVALVGLVSMIREYAVPLLVLVAAPFVCERFGWAGWRRLLLASLACLALMGGFKVINQWSYRRNPAWAQFVEYNRLRGELQGTPLVQYACRAAPAVGWSSNDALMFFNFYFAEPEVYGSAAKLRQFSEQVRAMASEEPLSPHFSARYLFLPAVFGGDAGVLMNLAILNAAWCVLAVGALRRRCLVTLLVSYGLFVALSFYLRQTARLPERVSYNLPLFVHVICLYWAAGVPRVTPAADLRAGFGGVMAGLRRAGVWRLPVRVLALVWLVLYADQAYMLGERLWYPNAFQYRLKGISRRITEPLQTLLPAGRKPLLVTMPHDSLLDQSLRFNSCADRLPYSVLPLGWLAYSPLYYQCLESHHLQPFSLALVTRPEVFFVMEKRWLKPLETFYREHWGREIRFEQVVNTDGMPRYQDCHLYVYQAHGTEVASQ